MKLKGLKCSNCKNKSIGFFEKLSLTYSEDTKCDSCYTKLGIKFSDSFIAALPFLFSIILTTFFNSKVTQITIIIIGSIFYIFFQVYIVPLRIIKKENKNKKFE